MWRRLLIMGLASGLLVAAPSGCGDSDDRGDPTDVKPPDMDGGPPAPLWCTRRALASDPSADGLLEVGVCDDALTAPDGRPWAAWRVVRVGMNGVETIADALSRNPDDAITVVLPAGNHVVPPLEGRSLAILGAGPSVTRLLPVAGAEVTVRADGLDTLALVDLEVVGATTGMHLTGVATAIIDRVVINVDRVGLTADRVGQLLLEDSVVQGAEQTHVFVIESGMVIRRSRIGAGTGQGISGGWHPNRPIPDTCEGSPNPVCPWGAVVQLDEAIISGVDRRGVSLTNARLVANRSVIETLPTPPGNQPVSIALALVQSFASLRSIDLGPALSGQAATLWSSRVLWWGGAVQGARAGGVYIDRLEAEAITPFPDGWPTTDSPWYTGAEAALDFDPWHGGDRPLIWGPDDFPDMDWRPRGPFVDPERPVPYALRPETDARSRSAEFGLHHWSYVEAQDIITTDCRKYGWRASGHPVRLRGLTVEGTLPDEQTGAEGHGIVMLQRRWVAIDDPGSSTLAYSDVLGSHITGSARVGLLVARTALLCKATGDSACDQPGPNPDEWNIGAPTAITARIERNDIDENALGGVWLQDAIADVRGNHFTGNSGIGLWAVGMIGEVAGNEISGVRSGDLVDRSGDGIEVADGSVIEPSEVWLGYELLAPIDWHDNIISGAERVGLLLVGDGLSLLGRLNVQAEAIDGNGLHDIAIIGDEGELEVELGEGVQFERVDAADVPPPGLCEAGSC